MNMFSNSGELNASSLQDAMQTIAKFASILQGGLPSNYGLAGTPDLTEEKRDELISRAIMTQDGKLALAQAMANPIRSN